MNDNNINNHLATLAELKTPEELIEKLVKDNNFRATFISCSLNQEEQLKFKEQFKKSQLNKEKISRSLLFLYPLSVQLIDIICEAYIETKSSDQKLKINHLLLNTIKNHLEAVEKKREDKPSGHFLKYKESIKQKLEKIQESEELVKKIEISRKDSKKKEQKLLGLEKELDDIESSLKIESLEKQIQELEKEKLAVQKTQRKVESLENELSRMNEEIFKLENQPKNFQEILSKEIQTYPKDELEKFI